MENLYKRSILIKNFNCYTASLDCNLILKEHIKKDKKKEIQELSRKSRLLLEKGAAYQNDIGFLKTNSNSLFNILFSGLTYILYYIHIIYDNSFSYKFFDTFEKKTDTAEFICHSRILRTMGLNFREYYCLQEKRMFQ